MRAVVVILPCLLSIACVEERLPQSRQQAVREPARLGPVSLADPADWKQVGPPGVFLTSPTPSPSGLWVAVSGFRGIGLTLLPARGGAAVVVQAGYRGPRPWLSDRDTLCLEDPNGGTTLVDVPRGERRPGPTGRCDPRIFLEEGLGIELHAGSAGRLYHHPRQDRLTLVGPGRAERRIAEAPMWDVSVSPAGDRVAYTTGTLAEPRLFVVDLAGGPPREIGAGAQPAWLPDGSALVFTVPTHVVRRLGTTAVEEADLWVHDCVAQTSRVLASTPGLAEMQPAVSPDGRTLYFADWRGGSVWAAALGREVRP